MGLIARAIENHGISTVALSLSRRVSEKVPPPRALFVRFPFGHALGEPEARNQQLCVLQLAFELLFSARRPGTIRDAGLRWRREVYPAVDPVHLRGLGPAPESNPGEGRP